MSRVHDVWTAGQHVYCRLEDESFGDSFVVWQLKGCRWEVAGEQRVALDAREAFVDFINSAVLESREK